MWSGRSTSKPPRLDFVIGCLVLKFPKYTYLSVIKRNTVQILKKCWTWAFKSKKLTIIMPGTNVWEKQCVLYKTKLEYFLIQRSSLPWTEVLRHHHHPDWFLCPARASSLRWTRSCVSTQNRSCVELEARARSSQIWTSHRHRRHHRLGKCLASFRTLCAASRYLQRFRECRTDLSPQHFQYRSHWWLSKKLECHYN